MAITAQTITMIICDGFAAPCSAKSELTLPHNQSVALRMAVSKGWSLADGFICPGCIEGLKTIVRALTVGVCLLRQLSGDAAPARTAFDAAA